MPDLEIIEQLIAACGNRDSCHRWHCSDMAALLARIHALEAGLRKYGEHVEDCSWLTLTECSCGLARLVEEEKP